MKFKTWSYRLAEKILDRRIRNEIEEIIKSINVPPEGFSRPELNKIFREKFLQAGWKEEPKVAEEKYIGAKLDYLKERVGVEVAFSHSSFLGIDLLKFQVMSFSALDKIDVGVYIAVTNEFLKILVHKYKRKWGGSLTFEKIVRYLPYFKSAIQVPIFVIGLEE